MPFDGSGNFNRTFPPGGWQGDAAASIKIKADRHDQHDADLAQGLGNAICRDGQSQVAANIPWNGKRIVNLGAPVDANDAVTKAYADTLKNFSTGLTLPGANANGRLTFSAPTGVNGIAWSATDLFFGTREDVASQSPNRFVFNSNVAATSDADVLNISETGVIGAPSTLTMATNGFYVGTAWRTPVAGTATVFQMSNGGAHLYANVAATTENHGIATMHNWWSVTEGDGNVTMALNKSASGKGIDLIGRMNGKTRWDIQLGNGIAETGANAGSNFTIYSFNDDATVATAAMDILRADNHAIFHGVLSADGSIDAGGTVTAHNAIFQGAPATAILAPQGAGQVHLRPNGPASATGEVIVNASGILYIGGATIGGVNTKIISPSIMYSSVSQTSGSSHHTFNNPNGQVGAINTTNSSTAYVTSSDERLKDFTGAFDPEAAAAIIKADPVRRFTWKQGGIAAVGWGAQTSHEVDPDLAEQPVEPDGNWGIDYGRRTPYLWAALSGALDRIAELEARLAALEGAA